MLEDIRIATPCTVDWESMRGSGFRRFCGSCRRSVYNIASMTRQEAEALIGRTEGRVCVRLFRRFDGTVLTRDCPGQSRWRHLKRWTAAAFLLLLPVVVGLVSQDFRRLIARVYPKPISSWIHKAPMVQGEAPPLMGKLMAPSPPPPPPTP